MTDWSCGHPSRPRRPRVGYGERVHGDGRARKGRTADLRLRAGPIKRYASARAARAARKTQMRIIRKRTPVATRFATTRTASSIDFAG